MVANTWTDVSVNVLTNHINTDDALTPDRREQQSLRAKLQHWAVRCDRMRSSARFCCFACVVVSLGFGCCSIDHRSCPCVCPQDLTARNVIFPRRRSVRTKINPCIFHIVCNSASLYAIINHRPLIFPRPPSLTARNVIFSLSVCSLESSPPPLVSSAIFFFKLSLLHTYCTLLSSHKP